MILTEQSNPNTRNIDHRSTVGILKSINNEDARVVAGSTRLKAETAQKIVLNMISTATMIRLGNVYLNLMVNLNLSNRKLTRREIRIVVEVATSPRKRRRWHSRRRKTPDRPPSLNLAGRRPE